MDFCHSCAVLYQNWLQISISADQALNHLHSSSIQLDAIACCMYATCIIRCTVRSLATSYPDVVRLLPRMAVLAHQQVSRPYLDH